MEFWPRWRHWWKSFASSYNQKKDNNQFKNKKSPELPENLTGSSTTKELKKKHSSRMVGGMEMDRWVEKTHGKVADLGEVGAG